MSHKPNLIRFVTRYCKPDMHDSIPLPVRQGLAVTTDAYLDHDAAACRAVRPAGAENRQDL